MNGQEFIDRLKSEYNISTNTALAELLGIAAPRITQMAQNDNITARVAVNITSRVANAVLNQKVGLIRPIVEFFPVECSREAEERSFINLKDDNVKANRIELRTALKAARGIYSFYNSEMEIIYVGKTKNDLWTEMKQTFHKKMNQYTRSPRRSSSRRLRY